MIFVANLQMPNSVKLSFLDTLYYISSIDQAEGGDFHGSGRWFQGMQDLCKKYGMNVSISNIWSSNYIFMTVPFYFHFHFSLFNFHFLNIPLLPFRSQLIIDEVQTGGGATGRLREASQIVKKIIHNLWNFISLPRKDVDARTLQSSRWDWCCYL